MTNTPNFFKRLKGIALSNNERLQMRERLAAYSDMHPAVDAAAQSGGVFAFFASRRFSTYAGALMAFMVLTSGITLAAEGSAPGDSLYAIKVNVNEPVMTVFSPTATGQAKIAAEIATRRADEAVVLASRGRLTIERQAYLTKEFEESLEIASRKAEELAQTGNSFEAENVKASLAANIAGEAQALGATEDDKNEGRREFLRILVAINDTISGDDVEAATAVTTMAMTMNQSGTTTPEGASAKTVQSATFTAKSAAGTATTSPRNYTVRFSKLRLASTTLPVHLNARLNTGGILAPKTDVAIPSAAAAADTSLTTGVGN